MELGRQLFFDKRLSRDQTLSCASCHDPKRAFSDGRAVARGINNAEGTRNSPARAVSTMKEPYAVYGHFYDATQGPRDAAEYLRLLRQHHPGARTLLEIACGMGAHLEPLAKHYDVTGLDISQTMLRYARRRLPRHALNRQAAASAVPRKAPT